MFFNLKTHTMSQKKNDNLGQKIPQEQTNVNYYNRSNVRFWRSNGIPSSNSTFEKLGQTSLIFTNSSKPSLEDDSIEASIKYLKFRKYNQ